MPVLFIEAPQGIQPDAKKQMLEKITSAIDEAYHIGDTLISYVSIQRKTSRWMGVFSQTTPQSSKL